jgi:hypothetical protein
MKLGPIAIHLCARRSKDSECDIATPRKWTLGVAVQGQDSASATTCLKQRRLPLRSKFRSGPFLRSARQHEVGRQLRWDGFRHPIAKPRKVDAREQGLATAQDDR